MPEISTAALIAFMVGAVLGANFGAGVVILMQVGRDGIRKAARHEMEP